MEIIQTIRELFKDKTTILIILLAFLAGSVSNDFRSSNQQQKSNTVNIQQLQNSMVQMNRRMLYLARGQDRILCRMDGESPTECDRQVTENLPPVTIPFMNNAKGQAVPSDVTEIIFKRDSVGNER